MNAYELAEHADALAYYMTGDWINGKPKNIATDIADMLRQQQAKIEMLKATPQYKELSRNDITEVIAEFAINSLANNLDYYDFANVILKKASEK